MKTKNVRVRFVNEDEQLISNVQTNETVLLNHRFHHIRPII
jgi:hypothetical protein